MIRARRRALASLAALLVHPAGFAQKRADETQAAANPARGVAYSTVVAGYRLRFPVDHGAHPAFRTEWWYITGHLTNAQQAPLGFQVTFFRSRVAAADANPSAFAPRQLVVAHAAVSDPRAGRLLFDQRVARQGFGLAGAEAGSMRTWIDDWSLYRQDDTYRAAIPAREFGFDFLFTTTTSSLLNGDAGFSRKGRRPAAASYYYSLPHLSVTGTLSRDNRTETVTGRAWLDHEWSSSYLEPEAAGWDWIGINGADGAALMAFRMRARDGSVRWAGATYRDPAGTTRAFKPDEISFTGRRTWRSVRTGAAYPVGMQLRVGDIQLEIEPLFDDQEVDARLTAGTVYWEGAVSVSRNGRPFGEGYLELTGYWRALKV